MEGGGEYLEYKKADLEYRLVTMNSNLFSNHTYRTAIADRSEYLHSERGEGVRAARRKKKFISA